MLLFYRDAGRTYDVPVHQSATDSSRLRLPWRLKQ